MKRIGLLLLLLTLASGSVLAENLDPGPSIWSWSESVLFAGDSIEVDFGTNFGGGGAPAAGLQVQLLTDLSAAPIMQAMADGSTEVFNFTLTSDLGAVRLYARAVDPENGEATTEIGSLDPPPEIVLFQSDDNQTLDPGDSVELIYPIAPPQGALVELFLGKRVTSSHSASAQIGGIDGNDSETSFNFTLSEELFDFGDTEYLHLALDTGGHRYDASFGLLSGRWQTGYGFGDTGPFNVVTVAKVRHEIREISGSGSEEWALYLDQTRQPDFAVGALIIIQGTGTLFDGQRMEVTKWPANNDWAIVVRSYDKPLTVDEVIASGDLAAGTYGGVNPPQSFEGVFTIAENDDAWPVTAVSLAGETSIWVYSSRRPGQLAVGSRVVINGTGTVYDGVVSTVISLSANRADTFEIETGLPSSDIEGLNGYWLFVDFPRLSSTLANYDIQLQKGLNMISLPVKPVQPITAQSLLTQLDATVIIRLDVSRQIFVPYVPDISLDFSIDGGSGYIVNVTQPKTVRFSGTVWDNVHAAPNPASVLPTWAFVIGGKTNQLDVEKIRVRHLSNQAEYPVTLNDDRYTLTLADLNRTEVVKKGDRLQILVNDSRINYIITSVDLNRAFARIDVAASALIPTDFQLLPNYPNPFNPETWIPFNLPQSAQVRIQIYDMKGQVVRNIEVGSRPAGNYHSPGRAVYWDGKTDLGEMVASGVYFYHLSAGNYASIRRMVILK